MSHTELLDRIIDIYANYPITELNMDANKAAINSLMLQRDRAQHQVRKLKNETIYNKVLINAGKQLAQYMQTIEVLPEECRAAIATLLPPESVGVGLDELLDPNITEEDVDKGLLSMGVDPVALAERGSKFVQEAKAKDVEYLLRVEKSLLADVQQARKERDELQTTLTEERAKHKAQLKNLLDSIDGLLSKLP